MIWIDYAILAIVGISGVISLMRGFVREALSLAGWIAAFWIAIAYSGRGAAFLDGYVTEHSWRVAIAFVVLLVVVLVAVGIVLRMAGVVVQKTGMSGTDRSLGIVFGGVARNRDHGAAGTARRADGAAWGSMVEPIAAPAELCGFRAGDWHLSSRRRSARVGLRSGAAARRRGRVLIRMDQGHFKLAGGRGIGGLSPLSRAGEGLYTTPE